MRLRRAKAPRKMFTFDEVKQQVEAFDLAASSFLNLLGKYPDMLDLLKVLTQKRGTIQDLVELIGDLRLFGHPFREWTEKYLSDPENQKLAQAQKSAGERIIDEILFVTGSYKRDPTRGGDLAEFLGDKLFLVINNLQALQGFVLEALRDLKTYDSDPAPKKFKYKGFSVLNPEGLREDAALGLLDGVSYALALFKKKGLEDLVKQGVKNVIVRPLDAYGGEPEQGRKPENIHGRYNPQTKAIELHVQALGGSPRLMKNWVHEVFLHEFGHHVHMSYLSREAKEFWDGTWDPVAEAEAELLNNLRVSGKDRERFFKLIKGAGWNPQKAGRKVKGLDRIKFLSWLSESGAIKPDAKQVRLTESGARIFDFFQDPEGFVKEDWETVPGHMGLYAPHEFFRKDVQDEVREEVKRLRRVFLNRLWLSGSRGGYAYHVTPAVAERIKKQDRSVAEAVAQVAEQWGTPTEYGKTNVREDFAESFVQFMTSPQKMTENGLYRMKRTLWLSGFGGKSVMRVARRWLAKHGATPWVEQRMS